MMRCYIVYGTNYQGLSWTPLGCEKLVGKKLELFMIWEYMSRSLLSNVGIGLVRDPRIKDGQTSIKEIRIGLSIGVG